jgi:N-acetylglutamate synthase
MVMLNYKITSMTIDHYDEVYEFWKSVEGIGLSKTDSRENIRKFLNRNENLSFVATIDNTIIGTILGSHDGRRGYLHHLAVDLNYRSNGIGKSLVLKCLERFKEIGLDKSHIFVFIDNKHAIKFWDRMGYILRNDLLVMSLNIK